MSATYSGLTQTFTLTLSAPAALSSLACSPSTLSTSAVSTCTVTLTKEAPASGLAVALSSNSNLLTVPAQVIVDAGAAIATFPATAGTITAPVAAAITAVGNGITRSATITLAPSAQLTGLTCSSATIATPGSTTCTVTLSQAAPAGGAAIAISKNNGNLTVPPSVTVLSGSTSATFTASAAQLSADAAAQISAVYSGVTLNFSLTLSAAASPAEVSILSCAPSSLTSGGAASCTVTLSKPAPAGGLVVTLASNSGLLTVPPTVTVPAGGTSTSFPANAGTITSSSTATVTASANGVSQSTSITLGGSSQISSLACTPSAIATPGSTTCTVTLSAPAPAGGAVVTLVSGSASLSLPASVTIPGGSTNTTFAATGAQVSSDTTAQLTASYNGASQGFAITLQGPTQLLSFTCSAAGLASGASTTCTALISRAAPPAGLIITLSSSQPSVVSLPTSVSVPSGATSATVQATAAGSVPGSQTVVLSATYAGATQSANITVSQNALLSSFSCGNLTLEASASSDCTVSLSVAAPAGGVTVSLSGTGFAPVQVPISVNVPAGATSATFSIKAGPTILTDVTVSLTASIAGSSLSVNLKLAGPVVLSTLQCPSTDVDAGSPMTCSVALSRPATANLSVALSSDSPFATVPASVPVSTGSSSATFVVQTTVPSAVVTANLSASLDSVSRTLALQIRPVSITSLSLSCNPSVIVAEGSSLCTVQMSRTAPAGGVTVQVSGDAALASLPTGVPIAGGTSSASFEAQFRTVERDGAATLSASYGSASATARVNLESLKPTSLTCSPKQLAASDTVQCTVLLNSSAFTRTVTLSAASDNGNFLVPNALVTRAHQNTVTFLGDVRPVSVQENAQVTVSFGGASVRDTVTVVPPRTPRITAPGFVSGRIGTRLNFAVSGEDPRGMAFALTAENVPQGAVFVSHTGEFSWTPELEQAGLYNVTFAITNLELLSARVTVQIEVVGDRPVIASVNDAAAWTTTTPCSPGGLATVVGTGFTGQSAEVLTSLPAPSALAGARVKINGSTVPLLYSSGKQINFQCPNLAVGSDYSLVVENSGGSSRAYLGTMAQAVPGIFTVNGSGKGAGAILLGGTATLAQARNPLYLAQPAQPGDIVSIFATGLGALDNSVELGAGAPVAPLARVTMPLTAWIGGALADVVYAGLAPGFVGLYQVNAIVPVSSEIGNNVSVRLELTDSDGRVLRSNQVTAAVEPPLR
ncbi:MAG: hypothetical protein ACKV22_01010 [Bryobacteraceae bacterium]